MATLTKLEEGIAALKADLLRPDGPRISTMRNYNFAILWYPPSRELELRHRIRTLVGELKSAGNDVLPIDLQEVFHARIRALGQDTIQSTIAREKRLFAKASDRAVGYLKDRLAPLVEGPDGIAADVIRLIDEHVERHRNRVDRTIVFIARAGALYPFFRSSALLKHIDGRTRNLPTILLYPGKREGQTALQFMEELPSDRDYRPRIYPDA